MSSTPLFVALEGAPAVERPRPPFHGGGPTPVVPVREQVAMLHASAVEALDLLHDGEAAPAAFIDADVRAHLRAHGGEIFAGTERDVGPTWARREGTTGDVAALEGHRDAGAKDSGVLRGLRAAASAAASQQRGDDAVASRAVRHGFAHLAGALGRSWPGRARAWLHDMDAHVVEAEASALLVDKHALLLLAFTRVLWRGGDEDDRLSSLLVRLSPPRYQSPTGPLVDHFGLLLKVDRDTTWHTDLTIEDVLARAGVARADPVRAEIERALADNDTWVRWLRGVAPAPADDPTRAFAERAVEFLARGADIFADGTPTLTPTDDALVRSLGRIRGVDALVTDARPAPEQMVGFMPPGRCTVYAPRIARTRLVPFDVASAVAVKDDTGEVGAIHLRRNAITISVRVGGPLRVGYSGRMGSLDEAPRGRALAHPRTGEHVAFAIAAALLSDDGPSVVRCGTLHVANEAADGATDGDAAAHVLDVFARAADLGVAPIAGHAGLHLVAGTRAAIDDGLKRT